MSLHRFEYAFITKSLQSNRFSHNTQERHGKVTDFIYSSYECGNV